MIGTIEDPRVAIAIGEACGEAAHHVRTRLGRSTRREQQGQAGSREEGFTDDLADAIDDMSEALSVEINTLSEAQMLGPNVRVQFSTEKAKHGEESPFGLDLGVRVIVETPGYLTEKAILVQCKRMTGAGATGSFPMLRGDGETQAEKMLRVTPSSFFFLFNDGPIADLLRMMRLAPLVPLWQPYWDPMWRHEGYFDPGVTVLPATRVLSMSNAARAGKTLFPIAARDVLAGSVPLGHFIAGLFASYFVGDVRKRVVQLATPPTLRGSVTGLDADVPELAHLNAGRFYKFTVTKSGPVDRT